MKDVFRILKELGVMLVGAAIMVLGWALFRGVGLNIGNSITETVLIFIAFFSHTAMRISTNIKRTSDFELVLFSHIIIFHCGSYIFMSK